MTTLAEKKGVVTVNFDEVLSGMFPNESENKAIPIASQPRYEEEEEVDSAPLPTCPRCDMEMSYGETTKQDGELWTYFRCPNEQEGVKCFVTCGTSPDCTFNVYMDQILHTLHESYHLSNGEDDKIPFINMECFCPRGLILGLSKSKKNPNRLYFKCASNTCKFFQWADMKPIGKVASWLKSRIHPQDVATMRRNPPSNLIAAPGHNYRRPAEATPKKRYKPYPHPARVSRQVTSQQHQDQLQLQRHI